MGDGIYPDEWEVQDYLGKDSDKAKAQRLDDVIAECEGYLKYLEDRGLALNEREKTKKRTCEITLNIAKGEK